jgi:hypothetical protein
LALRWKSCGAMWRSTVIVALAALSGCTATPSSLFLQSHPDFSPLVPAEGRTEYQVSWYRSWKPTIQLVASRTRDNYGEFDRAFVAFTLSESSVGSLQRREISLSAWRRIEEAVAVANFWTYDSACDELAYKTRSLYATADGGCEEYLMTDGSRISIAGSDGSRARGVTRSCPDLELCEPLGRIPRAILLAIDREDWALK